MGTLHLSIQSGNRRTSLFRISAGVCRCKAQTRHLELYATLNKGACGQYYEGKKQALSENNSSSTLRHDIRGTPPAAAFQYHGGMEHPSSKAPFRWTALKVDSGACHLGRGRDVTHLPAWRTQILHRLLPRTGGDTA